MDACELCRTPSEKLLLDHDHLTGLDRGYLCARCNIGLEMFRDSPETLTRAIMYLERTTHQLVPRYAQRPPIVFTPRAVLALKQERATDTLPLWHPLSVTDKQSDSA